MFRKLHPITGALALVTIGGFWLATAATELTGHLPAIIAVKTAIPWGFLWLVPLMIAAGASGAAHGHRSPWAKRKTARMRVAAINGIAVLVPSALFLASQARSGQFGAAFYTVQALELIAGATNITLLALNMRDGLRRAHVKKARQA